MRTTRLWSVLVAVLFAVVACERRDGQNAESGGPVTPAPIGTSTRTGAPTAQPKPPERDEAPLAALGADVSVWEGRRSARVTFVPTPEPAGFPTGAFRAATKMCLEETHAPAELTLALELATQAGRVRTVSMAAGLGLGHHGDGGADAGATSPLVACLQRLYAKITVAKMPARFTASVSVAPAAD